jgi:alpha/beta superfamily hydrolase
MHPDKPVIAGGFSFGSWVATRAACEDPDIRAVFLIGTPVNKYDFSYLHSCEKPMLFLHGTNDEHGDVNKVEKLAQGVRNAETIVVTGADHFFSKQLDAVEETMRTWAEEILAG